MRHAISRYVLEEHAAAARAALDGRAFRGRVLVL